MRTWLVRATLLAVSCVAVPRAYAQDHKGPAVELFRQASESFERGDYARAAKDFERSFEHIPRAAAMFNAARSWDRAAETARAADDYLFAIERTDLGGSEATFAKRRLKELEQSLGLLQVSAPSGSKVFVDRLDGAPAPIKVHLPPADYSVRVVNADGTMQDRRVQVDLGPSTSVAFSAPKPLVPVSRPSEAAGPTGAPLSAPPMPPVATREGGVQRTLGWTAVGASAASVGAAVALGVATLRARDHFDANPTSESALDDAKTLRTWTNVAWISAAVFAVSGVVLLLTAPRSARRLGAWTTWTPRLQ